MPIKKKNKNSKNNLFLRIIRSKESGIFFILLFICISLALAAPQFLQVSNLTNVARQMSVIAIISVGMTYVIASGGIDLSVGSITAFAGCTTALLIVNGYPLIFCILVGLGLGALVGLVNGVLVVYIKLAPFIATLGTMAIARGLVLVLTRGYPIQPFPKEFNLIGRGYLGFLPIPVLIMIVIIVIGHILLSRTKIGRYIYYIGSNVNAARLSGLNVKGTVLFVYTISGFLAGLASIVLTSRLTSAQSNMGSGFELDAIAAVVIGGASLFGGEGTVLGSLIGAALMGVIKNALILLGVNVYWQSVVIGGIIVIAVSIDALRKNEFKFKLKELFLGRKKIKVAIVFFIIIFLVISGSYFLINRLGSEHASPNKQFSSTILPVEIDPEKEFEINEEMVVCGNVLLVNSVTIQTEENSDFLVIDLEITNQSTKQVPINSFDFTVVDGNGDVHTDVAIGRTENPLGSHRLDPNQSVAGKVAFNVPNEDRKVKLIWQPGWCTEVVYIVLF